MLDKKFNDSSSKKKQLKKTVASGILNRPINPEFLKNAVNKSDGIEIKTNQPLLPLNENYPYKKNYNIDQEEKTEMQQRNSPKKPNTNKLSPTKNINQISSDLEYVKKPVNPSPSKYLEINKTPAKNFEPNKGLNSGEYLEIMEKMNQIIMVFFSFPFLKLFLATKSFI